MGNTKTRTSLEVLWLRLRASTAGDTRFPGQGAKIPNVAWCSKKNPKQTNKQKNTKANPPIGRGSKNKAISKELLKFRVDR